MALGPGSEGGERGGEARRGGGNGWIGQGGAVGVGLIASEATAAAGGELRRRGEALAMAASTAGREQVREKRWAGLGQALGAR